MSIKTSDIIRNKILYKDFGFSHKEIAEMNEAIYGKNSFTAPPIEISKKELMDSFYNDHPELKKLIMFKSKQRPKPPQRHVPSPNYNRYRERLFRIYGRIN